MNKTIYIGYSIDMDGPNHIKVFDDGCNNLINFFKEINQLNSCTWLLNHNKGYDTLGMHTELIKKIYIIIKQEGGCLGLHTHFNSSCYNPPENSFCPEIPGVTRGGWTEMQADKNYWYDDGLCNPKKEIEDFIKKNFNDIYNIECFKSGNHMKNKVLFESLMELGFKYDCSYGYEIKRSYKYEDKEFIVYDDSNILINNGPFVLKNNNMQILEIPECSNISKIKNIDNNFFYLYQIHPDEISNLWDKTNIKDKRNIILKNIIQLKKLLPNHKIIYCNMKEMGEIILKSNKYNIYSLNDMF